ncbi:cell growth-regulating nucleolar protein [Bufo bufo]|uniref:cell growth-regulating nucleolar protein n=1 Tax=Bufo bufo TaxID=8384 RepID=UPI001ABDD59C|nr:cell growth-regulating nucleolar protein [Bufo bufo]
MVFFTCNGCGESLKKAQVEKHLVSCRSCQCLSCIDCGKDFWGDEYKTHLKCLTEDEKYGGKAFEAKANKGDVKQQQWIQRIHEAMKKPNISDNIRNILSKISTYENVPRKKAKFQNWMINCLKVNNQAVQDAVWECFSEATSNQKDNANNNAPKPSNTSEAQSKSESSAATEETEKKSKRERKEERQKKNRREKKDLNSEEPLQNGAKKKGKKRKMEDEANGHDEANDEETRGKKKKKKQQQRECEGGEKEAPRQKKKRNDSEGEVQEAEADENGADDDGEEDSGKKGKFNWKGTIKALLKQAPDNELPIKKLRKKVIAQYHAVSSEHHRSEEVLLATFNKKVQNNPKFRVLKERVKLVK